MVARSFPLAVLLALAWASPAAVYAEPPDGHIPPTIREKIAPLIPKHESGAVEISPSPIENLYEVSVGDTRFFVDKTGTYLISGDMYTIASQTKTLSSNARKKIIQKIERYGSDRMLIYGKKSNRKSVYVITDYTCPYCTKFHRGVPSIVASNITVKYILFSRHGVRSPSARTMSKIFCAPPRARTALFDQLVQNGTLSYQSCKNDALAAADALAQQINLSGTPMIITESGEVIGGYLTAEELKKRLEHR